MNRDLNGLDRESVGLGELSGERACGGSISAEDCHAYYLALAYYTRGAHAEETDDVGQDREIPGPSKVFYIKYGSKHPIRIPLVSTPTVKPLHTSKLTFQHESTIPRRGDVLGC